MTTAPNGGMEAATATTDRSASDQGLTPYHAKYFAYELTKRCASDSNEKLAGALVDAQVDLNPHQIEAALFAFSSPLSKGGILADEVGLGKTIEAGLVISQKWAERRRRILVITPANLRKQWHQELQEKFFLPCRILETKSYNYATKNRNLRPFDCDDDRAGPRSRDGFSSPPWYPTQTSKWPPSARRKAVRVF